MGNGLLALLATISCWPKSLAVCHQVAIDFQWICLTLVERMLGYSIYMSTCIEYLESVACPLEDHFKTFDCSSNNILGLPYRLYCILVHSNKEFKCFELGFHIEVVTLPGSLVAHS